MTRRKAQYMLFALIAAIVAAACGDAVVPKPRGYFRIQLPEPQYEPFDSAAAPYRFEKPVYSIIEPDRDANSEPFWINIFYPRYNCKIHVTYRDIRTNAADALEDSRKLAYKHTIKADAIGESFYENTDRHVFGTLYRIKGNAATPLQFELTDSVRNLFRGSLYFYCKPNKDSLAPVVALVETDIIHLMETFNWN